MSDPISERQSMHQENVGEISAVRQRVLTVEREVHEIKDGMEGLRNTVVAGFDRIRTEMSARAQPQWQAYSVILLFCVSLGGALYYPIRESGQETRMLLRDSTLETRALLKDMAQGSVDRDRRLWDFAIETRSRVDRMDGELHGRRP